MYSYGPSHMSGQKQDDQHEHTFSSYGRIRNVALKTCQRRWTIGKSGERGSGISVLAVRHDDDDEKNTLCLYIYIYIYACICQDSVDTDWTILSNCHFYNDWPDKRIGKNWHMLNTGDSVSRLSNFDICSLSMKFMNITNYIFSIYIYRESDKIISWVRNYSTSVSPKGLGTLMSRLGETVVG